MDFNKRNVILAPMVRVSTLPMRLLCIEYGADIVFTDEIIDYKLLRCKKIQNEVLGTIDYMLEDGSLTFRTSVKEKEKLIFQMGTNDPDRALKAAKMIENEVSALDINMGCPKDFSLRGGMGAALLSHPDKISKLEKTIDLVRIISKTGVSAITIHGRLKEERPRHPCRIDWIKEIAKTFPNLPINVNGVSKLVKTHDDIFAILDKCHPSRGLMLARALMWDPSLLRSQGQLDGDVIIAHYLKYCIDYDSVDMNAKYCIQHLMRTRLESVKGKMLAASGSLRQMACIWDLGDYYDNVTKSRTSNIIKRPSVNDEIPCSIITDMKIDIIELNGDKVHNSPFKYNRRNYGDKESPKMTLYSESVKNKLPKPHYIFEYNKSLQIYRCTLQYNGFKFRSSIWDKSKKHAEQATACVCLKHLGIHDTSMNEQQIAEKIAKYVATV